MGDRGNIVVHGVWLYTHWGGSDIKKDLQKALQRHLRWDDYIYLTRIIFDQMKGNDFGETGFGISTKMCDNEWNILEVDCDHQVVIEKTEAGQEVKKWTFEEYVREKFKEDIE
ncbi:hypothetical protein LCGC14_2510200 [marine sediment metagenome]|uniref:Uncharacterized protein n=1 Tax=marine sediment metagenome TaxID=412755 RepID=A0A0F9BM85_9ZZZZ